MKTIQKAAFLMILLPAFCSVGCGNIYSKNLEYAPANSRVPYSYTSNSTQIAAKYSCPTLPNVLPINETLNGSEFFTVCTSKSTGDFSDIYVTGKFSPSSQLCAIPVQPTSGAQFSFILNSQNGPIYTCAAPDVNGGVPLSIPEDNRASFNTVIIVEASKLNAMLLCSANNFSNCPDFSVGEFRQ